MLQPLDPTGLNVSAGLNEESNTMAVSDQPAGRVFSAQRLISASRSPPPVPRLEDLPRERQLARVAARVQTHLTAAVAAGGIDGLARYYTLTDLRCADMDSATEPFCTALAARTFLYHLKMERVRAPDVRQYIVLILKVCDLIPASEQDIHPFITTVLRRGIFGLPPVTGAPPEIREFPPHCVVLLPTGKYTAVSYLAGELARRSSIGSATITSPRGVPPSIISEWISMLENYSAGAAAPAVVTRADILLVRTGIRTNREQMFISLQRAVRTAPADRVPLDMIQLQYEQLRKLVPDIRTADHHDRALIVALSRIFVRFRSPVRNEFMLRYLYPVLEAPDERIQSLLDTSELRPLLLSMMLEHCIQGVQPAYVTPQGLVARATRTTGFYACISALLRPLLRDEPDAAAHLAALMDFKMPQAAYFMSAFALDSEVDAQALGRAIMQLVRSTALVMTQKDDLENDRVAAIINRRSSMVFNVIFTLHEMIRRCSTTDTGRAFAVLELLRAIIRPITIKTLGSFAAQSFGESCDIQVEPQMLCSEMALMLHGDGADAAIDACLQFVAAQLERCGHCKQPKRYSLTCAITGREHVPNYALLSRLIETLAVAACTVSQVQEGIVNLLQKGEAMLQTTTHQLIYQLIKYSGQQRSRLMGALEPYLRSLLATVQELDTRCAISSDARSSVIALYVHLILLLPMSAEEVQSTLRVLAQLQVRNMQDALMLWWACHRVIRAGKGKVDLMPLHPQETNYGEAYAAVGEFFSSRNSYADNMFNIIYENPSAMDASAGPSGVSGVNAGESAGAPPSALSAVSPVSPSSPAAADNAQLLLSILIRVHGYNDSMRKLLGVSLSRLIVDFNMQTANIVSSLLDVIGFVRGASLFELGISGESTAPMWRFIISQMQRSAPFRTVIITTAARCIGLRFAELRNDQVTVGLEASSSESKLIPIGQNSITIGAPDPSSHVFFLALRHACVENAQLAGVMALLISDWIKQGHSPQGYTSERPAEEQTITHSHGKYLVLSYLAVQFLYILQEARSRVPDTAATEIRILDEGLKTVSTALREYCIPSLASLMTLLAHDEPQLCYLVSSTGKAAQVVLRLPMSFCPPVGRSNQIRTESVGGLTISPRDTAGEGDDEFEKEQSSESQTFYAKLVRDDNLFELPEALLREISTVRDSNLMKKDFQRPAAPYYCEPRPASSAQQDPLEGDNMRRLPAPQPVEARALSSASAVQPGAGATFRGVREKLSGEVSAGDAVLRELVVPHNRLSGGDADADYFELYGDGADPDFPAETYSEGGAKMPYSPLTDGELADFCDLQEMTVRGTGTEVISGMGASDTAGRSQTDPEDKSAAQRRSGMPALRDTLAMDRSIAYSPDRTSLTTASSLPYPSDSARLAPPPRTQSTNASSVTTQTLYSANMHGADTAQTHNPEEIMTPSLDTAPAPPNQQVMATLPPTPLEPSVRVNPMLQAIHPQSTTPTFALSQFLKSQPANAISQPVISENQMPPSHIAEVKNEIQKQTNAEVGVPQDEQSNNAPKPPQIQRSGGLSRRLPGQALNYLASHQSFDSVVAELNELRRSLSAGRPTRLPDSVRASPAPGTISPGGVLTAVNQDGSATVVFDSKIAALYGDPALFTNNYQEPHQAYRPPPDRLLFSATLQNGSAPNCYNEPHKVQQHYYDPEKEAVAVGVAFVTENKSTGEGGEGREGSEGRRSNKRQRMLGVHPHVLSSSNTAHSGWGDRRSAFDGLDQDNRSALSDLSTLKREIAAMTLTQKSSAINTPMQMFPETALHRDFFQKQTVEESLNNLEALLDNRTKID